MREIDDDVRALGGREHEPVEDDRMLEEALVGADEHERQARLERERIEARVRAVQEAQPVAPRLDRRERPEHAVHDDRRAELLGLDARVRRAGVRGMRGDDELAVRREGPVLDEERDLVGAGGKPEPVLVLVADQVEAREPGADVEPRQPERVVVVPERGGFLVVRRSGTPPARKAGPRSAKPGVNQASGSPSLADST